MNEAVCVSRGQGEEKGGFRDLHVTLVAPLRSNSEYSHPSHSCPHPRLCMRPSSHAVAQPWEPVGRHRQGGGPESSTLRGLFGRADAQAEHLNIQSLTESERRTESEREREEGGKGEIKCIACPFAFKRNCRAAALAIWLTQRLLQTLQDAKSSAAQPHRKRRGPTQQRFPPDSRSLAPSSFPDYLRTP